MKYLNLTRANKNFFVMENVLYNINHKIPIADLTNSQSPKNGKKMSESVEFYQSGAKVTIEYAGEKCIQFFGNDGKKVVETFCHKGENQEDVSILPIDLGVFSSQFVGKRLMYKYVDYQRENTFMDHNFSKVYKSVEAQVERKKRESQILTRTEKFKVAISKLGKEECLQKRA